MGTVILLDFSDGAHPQFDRCLWFGGNIGNMDYTSQIEQNIRRLNTYRTMDGDIPVRNFNIRDIQGNDRVKFSFPTKGMLDPVSVAMRTTHLAIVSDGGDVPTFVYRVTGYNTLSSVSQSIGFSLELDPVATSTINAASGTVPTVRGSWDVWYRDLGVKSVPYDNPLTIIQPASVSLPHTTLQGTIGDRNVSITLVYVYISGIADGAYKVAKCVCCCDTSIRQPSQLSIGIEYGGRFVRFPTLQEIINDPQSFTPFATSGSIVSVSVSLRAVEDVGEPSVVAGSPLRVIASAGEGTPFLIPTSETVVLIDSNPLLKSHSVSVDATIPFDKEGWPMVSFEVRDMMGNVVGTIDQRYGVTSGGRKVLRNLRLESALTLTSVESRLIMPDGSVIKWLEGNLPYNTNAYLDYLMTQQRYDREMLGISQQRALNNLIASAGSSLSTGLIAGGLSNSNIIGAISGAGGVLTGFLEYELNKELSFRELEVKQEQIQSIPDSAYTSSSDTYVNNAHTIHDYNIFLPCDKIVARTPLGSVADASDHVTWSNDYLDYFRTVGYYAGGRMSTLGDSFDEYTGCNIKLKDVTLLDIDVKTIEGELHPLPIWLQSSFLSRLKMGCKLQYVEGIQ